MNRSSALEEPSVAATVNFALLQAAIKIAFGVLIAALNGSSSVGGTSRHLGLLENVCGSLLHKGLSKDGAAVVVLDPDEHSLSVLQANACFKNLLEFDTAGGVCEAKNPAQGDKDTPSNDQSLFCIKRRGVPLACLLAELRTNKHRPGQTTFMDYVQTYIRSLGSDDQQQATFNRSTPAVNQKFKVRHFSPSSAWLDAKITCLDKDLKLVTILLKRRLPSARKRQWSGDQAEISSLSDGVYIQCTLRNRSKVDNFELQENQNALKLTMSQEVRLCESNGSALANDHNLAQTSRKQSQSESSKSQSIFNSDVEIQSFSQRDSEHNSSHTSGPELCHMHFEETFASLKMQDNFDKAQNSGFASDDEPPKRKASRKRATSPSQQDEQENWMDAQKASQSNATNTPVISFVAPSSKRIAKPMRRAKFSNFIKPKIESRAVKINNKIQQLGSSSIKISQNPTQSGKSQDSPSKIKNMMGRCTAKPDLDVLSAQSTPTHFSVGIESRRLLSTNCHPTADQRKTQDNVFVFKIIHDLRHPIQAITDSLGSTDQTLRYHLQVSKELFISESRMRDHPTVKKALELIGLQLQRRRGQKLRDAKTRLFPVRTRSCIDDASPMSITRTSPPYGYSGSNLHSMIDSGPVSDFGSLQLSQEYLFSAAKNQMLNQSSSHAANPSGSDSMTSKPRICAESSGSPSSSSAASFRSALARAKAQRPTAAELKERIPHMWAAIGAISLNQIKNAPTIRERAKRKEQKNARKHLKAQISEESKVACSLRHFADSWAVKSMDQEQQPRRQSKAWSVKYKTDVVKYDTQLSSPAPFPRKLDRGRNKQERSSAKRVKNHNSTSPKNVDAVNTLRSLQALEALPKIPLFKVRPTHNLLSEQRGNSQLDNGTEMYVIKVLIADRERLISILERLVLHGKKLHKTLKAMQSQSQMSMTFCKDLMNFAQLKNDTFTLEPEFFDMRRAMRSCIQMQNSQAELRKVKLVGPIFSQPMDRLLFKSVYGDIRRISQVVVNFISNAVKFSPENGTVSLLLAIMSKRELQTTDLSNQVQTLGSNQARASSSGQSKHNCYLPSHGSLYDASVGSCASSSVEYFEADGESISEAQGEEGGASPLQPSGRVCTFLIEYEVTVRDQGAGISPENISRLFRNFSKLEENKEQNKQGVGLGLSICHEIVAKSGGSIDVRSKLGAGTDFVIKMRSKASYAESYRENFVKRLQDDEGQLSSDSDGEADAVPLDEQASQNSAATSQRFSNQSFQNNSPLVRSTRLKMKPERQSLQKLGLSLVDESGSEESKEMPGLASRQPGYPSMAMAKPAEGQDGYKEAISALLLAQQQRAQISHKLLSKVGEQHSELEESKAERSSDSQSDLSYQSLSEGDNWRVLIANDNEFLLNCFAECLAERFSQVDRAVDGRMAAEVVEAHPVDYYAAIVLDYDMPHMNGAEAYIRMVEHFKQHDAASEGKRKELNTGMAPDGQLMGPKVPFVYAVTGNELPSVHKRLNELGFKQICKCPLAVQESVFLACAVSKLGPDQLATIAENAGLPDPLSEEECQSLEEQAFGKIERPAMLQRKNHNLSTSNEADKDASKRLESLLLPQEESDLESDEHSVSLPSSYQDHQ